jgi:predicted sugar kinase
VQQEHNQLHLLLRLLLLFLVPAVFDEDVARALHYMKAFNVLAAAAAAAPRRV